MKNRYYLIAMWASLCLSCSKEFLNDCDQESPAFKTVKADFGFTVNNNIVSFKNNSINAETYSWEFGDGTTSNSFEVNKSFAYSNKPYNVKLVVSRCGGERQSSVTKNLEINCTTKAPEIIADKSTICSGETSILSLKSACTTGNTVRWSNGATTNTITVNNSGKYTAQCIAACPSPSSNEIEVKVNPRPNQPSISGSTFDVCEGSSFTLPATTCNIGTVVWNDGTTGLSKTPTTTSSYTVNCNGNNCISQASNAFTLRVTPSKATVSTLDGSLASSIISNTITFRGSIDFKSANSVEDHGFIYKSTLTDTPFKIGDAGVTTISLGSKPLSTGSSFNRVFNNSSKDFSFIAYIKDCSGYKYGTIKKL
jgi:hypothetical protein